MTPYRHTQCGWLTVLSLGIPALGCVVLFLTIPGPFHWLPLGIAVLFVVLSYLFFSMRIEVDGEEIRMAMGPGVVRKRWPLAECVSARQIKTRFIDGWGIHLTRDGWLYNVNIPHAVRIRFKNGRGVVLGTDEPEQLLAALEEAGLSIETEE